VSDRSHTVRLYLRAERLEKRLAALFWSTPPSDVNREIKRLCYDATQLRMELDRRLARP